MSENQEQTDWRQWRVVAKGTLVVFLPMFALLAGTIAVVHFSQIGAHLMAIKEGELHSVDLERRYVVADVRSVASDLLFLSTVGELDKLLQSSGLPDPGPRPR